MKRPATLTYAATLALAIVITTGTVTAATPDNEAKTATKAAESVDGKRQPLDLMQAYKLEFAFLEAEKAALTRRLASVKAETRRTVGALDATISRKGKTLLGIRAESERLATELETLGRETTDVGEQSELLPETLERAWASLDKMGIEPPAVSDAGTLEGRLKRLQAAVVGAVEVITRQGQIQRREGTFFGLGGTKHGGTIIHVGGVARFGVAQEPSGTVAGALVPAGRGHFKLWQADAANVATALAQGEVPSTLKLYLFDNANKAVEQKVDKTVEDIVNSGGSIAWVIVGLGGVALLLLLLRSIVLALLGYGGRRTLHAVETALSRGDLAGAKTAAEGSGGVARVVRAALERLHGPRQPLEDGISEALLNEQPRVERFGTALKVIAAVAPLMGLLGTVTGMISTFDIITEFGTGDPKLLAGGISEALVTTELGLIVAIPTLLLGTLLAGRAAQIQTAMERAAIHTVNVAELAGVAGVGVPDNPSGGAPMSPQPSATAAPSGTPSSLSQESSWTTPSTSPAT